MPMKQLQRWQPMIMGLSRHKYLNLKYNQTQEVLLRQILLQILMGFHPRLLQQLKTTPAVWLIC